MMMLPAPSISESAPRAEQGDRAGQHRGGFLSPKSSSVPKAGVTACTNGANPRS